MTDTITIPDPGGDYDRVRKWVDAAHALYGEAQEQTALAGLRGVCLVLRKHFPHAVRVVFDQSDQGDHAVYSGVLSADGQRLDPTYGEEGYEDIEVDIDNDVTDFAYDLTLYNASVWANPLTVVDGYIDERHGIQQVVLDIDKCLELAQQPRLLPNEVEVWTLTVDDGGTDQHVVTVHATQDECFETFRLNYDQSAEYADVPNAFLEDHISERFWIDSHVVTVP